MAVTLPPPPIGVDIIQPGGNVSALWRQWFTLLYRKLGGSEDIDLSGLTADTSSLNILGSGNIGDMISWSALNTPTRIATGTSGQVLTSNGSGTEPTWQSSAAATASYSLVSTTAINDGDSSVTIKNLDDSFGSYRLVFTGIKPGTDSVGLYMRISTDNGATFETGAADYAWSAFASNSGGTPNDVDDSDSVISLIHNGGFYTMSSTTGNELSGTMEIYEPNDSNTTPLFNWRVAWTRTNGNLLCQASGVGKYRGGHTSFNAIQLFPSSGQFKEGSISLYGSKV